MPNTITLAKPAPATPTAEVADRPMAVKASMNTVVVNPMNSVHSR